MVSSVRDSVRGVFAALGLLFLLSSCGTIDGQSAGDIAGKTTQKVGGAVDNVGKSISKLNDDAVKGLEKKFGPDVIDPDSGLNRDDYRQMLEPSTPYLRTDKYNEPAIPNVSQLLIDPKAPMVGKDKLITLNVTEDVPLKEVLVELARRADIDIELDPNIHGGIIFRAKDKPFSEVIDRIAELTGLRYSVQNGVLKVERDFPYVENYEVDFLNLTRSNSGSTTINTQLSGGGGGGGTGGGGGLGGGSQSSLQSKYEGDLWKSVEENIKNILANYGTNSPGISENATSRSVSDDGLGEVLGEAPRANAAPAVGQSVKVAPIGADKSPKIKSEGANASDIVPSGASILSINKQAGVISVLANQRQHREVLKFINQIKRQQSAQVLIEAKLVEVELDETHQNGIDWSVANIGGLALNSNFSAVPNPPGGAANFFTATLPSGNVNLQNFIQFAESFGVARTLSSPRINAINNQQAVLTFAQNFVYFEVQIQQNSPTVSSISGSSTPGPTNISSTAHTVPIGMILTLQPSINLDTNEITMNVRPTLTRKTNSVPDPAVALQAKLQGIVLSNDVPVIDVRELDSILKIKSGQVMVIGGLMDSRVDSSDKGIPWLSNLPFAGNLFKQSSKTKKLVETVIFIKATIVPGFGVDASDKKLYHKFTNDPHPLTF